MNRSESEAVFVRDFRRFRNRIPWVKTKIMIAGSDPEPSEPAIIMFCNVHIGFIQQVYKVEFVEFPVIANQSAFLVWQSPG